MEECQSEDGKALNQTSNFWNGLLEEDGNPLPVALDLDMLDQGRASTPKFDRSIGYCSDALSLYSKHLPGDEILDKVESKCKSTTNPSHNMKCQTKVGRSHFKLSRTKSDQLMHLKLKSTNSTIIKSETPTIVDSVLQVKAEPTDELKPSNSQTGFIDPLAPSIVSSTTDTRAFPSKETLMIKQEQIVTLCDATASHDYAAPVPCVVSTGNTSIIPTMVKSATLIRTSSIIPSSGQIWHQQNTNNSQGITTTTSGIRRQLNGPQGKENFIY